MKTLAVGDVCSQGGCEFLLKRLPVLKKETGADLVIVNGENSAQNNGISRQSADLIFAAGADVITGGNHSLRNKEIYSELDENPYLLRPDNIKSEFGTGYCLIDKGKFGAAVINLCGCIFMDRCEAANFMEYADKLVLRAKSEGAKYIFIDFHAETTSEKRALGFYLDGRVSAVFGTHTHIMTADAQILPCGTGYITDLGMTGPENSVLGVKKEIIINRLKNSDMSKFEFAEGKNILCGCLFECDESGLCTDIKPIIEREQ